MTIARVDQMKGETPIHSLTLRSLAKIPAFVRHPELHLVELKLAYQRMQADLEKLCLRMTKATGLTSSGFIRTPSLPSTTMRLYTHYQAAYGLLLALAMIYNGMLRAFDPYDIPLIQESESFSNEIITLAEHVSPYRPLGASYIPLCLVAAWAATDDTSRRAHVEKILAEYQTDFTQMKWMEGAIWLKTKFESQRLKLSTSHFDKPLESCGKTANATSVVPTEGMATSESCCIQ